MGTHDNIQVAEVLDDARALDVGTGLFCWRPDRGGRPTRETPKVDTCGCNLGAVNILFSLGDLDR